MRVKKYVLTALCLTLLCFGAAGIVAAAEPQTHTNSIGMEFVLIPAGSFMIGIDPNVEEDDNDETPPHQATISKPFYLGKYEVTQAQWVAVMGSNLSEFKGPDNPVEQVSWDDAQEFIRRLNAKEGHNRYRLPTEMEWELAARGGTNTEYFFGDSENALGQYAWFDGNSGDKTHPVGQKKTNQYGLYDIYGNVWEWCQDWYDYGDLLASRESKDYRGAMSGSLRVCRGGSWFNGTEYCRSSHRDNSSPDYRCPIVGFRLALSPE